jgi:predicted nucleotidyltransferase
MAISFSPTSLAEKIDPTLRLRPVTLAYLFGSLARGRADSESDIDIAVLLVPTLSKKERLAQRLELTESIAELLGRHSEDIDVVVLQDAPSLLRYNVVRSGQLLYARDGGARTAFEREVQRTYKDEEPFLERETTRTLQRILARRL